MTLDTRETECLVPVGSIAALTAEINRLSHASQRASGEPMRLIDTGVRRGDRALVRIESDGAALGGWEIIAVLHHEQGATRIETCVPLPCSELERLRESRALCEVCRTVRPRRQTWVLRDPSGRTVQVGSGCIRPLTGAASVGRALSHAQTLAAAQAALAAVARASESVLAGDEYIDTTTFLACAAAVIREHGFASAREPEATWRRALTAVETNARASRRDQQRALEIRAWAAALDPGADEYRRRLVECLGRERLSSRELPLATSAVRAYNRHLYWRIRHEKGRRRAVEAK